MAAEDVERFASELAEATDACARAQRVLLECHFDDDVDAGRAAADCGQAAKALEALAPVEGQNGRGGGGWKNRRRIQPLRRALRRRRRRGGSRGVPVPDPASQMPVSASDLAALHARAAMAVAADYDAAALDARDKLIEDQRATIRALVGALETRGGIREADVDGIPSGCTVAELESRHDALTRAAVGARGAAGASSRSKAPIIRRGSVGGRAGSPDSDASDRSDASRGAAVLPIRDIRVEAEALAARARAADTAARAGTPNEASETGTGTGTGTAGGRDGSARGVCWISSSTPRTPSSRRSGPRSPPPRTSGRPSRGTNRPRGRRDRYRPCPSARRRTGETSPRDEPSTTRGRRNTRKARPRAEATRAGRRAG